ncbi:MAG: hypothetical protein ACREA9_26780 [Pyrinomonadaceae bacterium]
MSAPFSLEDLTGYRSLGATIVLEVTNYDLQVLKVIGVAFCTESIGRARVRQIFTYST